MKPIKIILPKSWNELSIQQLERIALLFHTTSPGLNFDLKILFILLDVKWWHYLEKAKIRIVLWNVPISEIRNNYSFIYTKIDRTHFAPFLKIPLTYKSNPKCFFAPQDRIANLTSREFAVADDLHIKWRETKNIEYLQYLASVLYTPSKIRPVFDKNQLHTKAEIFKNIPLKKLLAMELTYFGCKKNIEKRFPKVFPKPIVGAEQPKKKYGFGKIILSMAKGDLSKVETIEKVNIYTFLEQFEEDLITASKNKK